VTDDDAGSSGSTGEGATVSEFGLNAGNNGTFGHRVDGEDIADLEGSFLTGIDEHTGVHAFNSNEILSIESISVLVSELDLSKWGSTSRIVNDILDDSLDVTLSLTKIKCSKFGWSNSLVSVCCEDTAASVSLS